MVRFRRLLALALAASTIAALAVPSSSSASAVLTTGTLTDGAGLPTTGTVQVRAWPHRKAWNETKVLGEARVVLGRLFSIRARDDQRLLRLARARDGWLDFAVSADTASGRRAWSPSPVSCVATRRGR